MRHWNSQVSCLETYKQNYNIYSEIWGKNIKKIPANIGKLIEKIGLYREARIFPEHMKTFRAALDKMQEGSCHLSDAVLFWYSLMKNNNLANHHKCNKKSYIFRNILIDKAYLGPNKVLSLCLNLKQVFSTPSG